MKSEAKIVNSFRLICIIVPVFLTPVAPVCSVERSENVEPTSSLSFHALLERAAYN